MAAGAVLGWARALGEFGATITFAGNLAGRTQTMPLAVFLALESDRGAGLALSLVLVAVSLAVLVAFRDRWFRAWDDAGRRHRPAARRRSTWTPRSPSGDGEVVALLGPNGAGKTTLLRAVAGLAARSQRGSGRGRGTVLDDPDAGVFVPPEDRPVGVVFQDYLLFPHLSVRRQRGVRAAVPRRVASRPRNRVAMAWLERFGLEDQGEGHPAALSGGQPQRVALARALAAAPRVLLLDEPLAALDVAGRRQVRGELVAHLRDFSGARLVVTHDPVEAVGLADRMVVLEDGRVRQEGTADQIRTPAPLRLRRRLVGVNLLPGTGAGRHVLLADGAEIHLAEESPDGDVLVAVRPQAVALFPTRPEGTPATSGCSMSSGSRETPIESGRPGRRHVVGGRGHPWAVAELHLVPGAEVWAAFKATDVEVYPA